jgi:hypothetical protein
LFVEVWAGNDGAVGMGIDKIKTLFEQERVRVLGANVQGVLALRKGTDNYSEKQEENIPKYSHGILSLE